MKIITPFGPKIGKSKIPSNIVKRINNEIDQIVKNKNNLKKHDYSKKVVGQVYQEIQLSKKFVNKNLKIYINKSISDYLKKTLNKKTKYINIKNCWVVRQFKNEYNPIHWHGGHLSGAGFLKTPKSWGKHIQDKGTNIYKGGNLNFVHGNHQFLSNSIYEVKPKVGEFFIFPNSDNHRNFFGI